MTERKKRGTAVARVAPAAAIAQNAASNPQLEAAERTMVALSAALVQRRDLALRSGATFVGDRNLSITLGYRLNPSYLDYLGKYERQDVAGRIIDMPVHETWKGSPVITDVGTDGKQDSEFTKAWTSIARKLQLWHLLERADRLSGIGQYSVLLLGLADKQNLDQPAATVRGPEDILFLAPYSQLNATVRSWDLDEQSPRFGLPETYTLTIHRPGTGFVPPGGSSENSNTGMTKVVHHSRLVHIADGLMEDNVYGRPKLQRVIDRLDDMLKSIGGSAEAFWLVAAPILHTDIDPKVDVAPGDLEKLDAQIQEMMHNLRRNLQTRGATVSSIGEQRFPDPTGILSGLQTLIASAAEIPMRILFGSERGELASTQDQEEWHGRIASRRERFAEPVVLRALIDKLVALNALPAPKNGSYEVQWPAMGEPSDDERASYVSKVSMVASTMSPSDPSRVVPPWEIRTLLRLPAVPPPPPPDWVMPDEPDGGESGDNASLETKPVTNAGKGAGAEDLNRAILRVADSLTPRARNQFIAAINSVKAQIDEKALLRALQTNNVDAALRAIGVDSIPAALRPSLETIRQAITQAAMKTAKDVAKTLGVPTFTTKANSHVVTYAAKQSAELVTDITNTTRETLRGVLERAAREGKTPAQVAREIRSHIGLTKQASAQVDAHRAEQIARGLTGERLEVSVDRFAASKLLERANVISRHEMVSAAVHGQVAAYEEANNQGYMRVNMNVMFTTGDGQMVAPGDRAHVQCRCGIAITPSVNDENVYVPRWTVTADERLCPICAPMPSMPENQF